MPRKDQRMSDGQRAKIAEALSGNTNATGSKRDDKFRAAVGAATKQRMSDPAARALVSTRMSNRLVSDATKRKMSESRKKLWAKNRDSMLRQVADARQNISFDATSIEVAIANALYSLGIQFESQKSTYPWRLDFYCEELSLAIECDGDYWHNLPVNQAKDARRDRDLAGHGIRVLHLTETDIKHNLQGCLNSIISTIAQQVQLKESE